MLLNSDNCLMFEEQMKIISKVGRNGLYKDYMQAFIFQIYQRGFRDIFKYVRQIFIEEFDTKTAKLWEEFIGIEPDKNYSLDDRITKILYTINAKYCCSINFLKEQAKFFTNGEIEVHEDPPNYSFEIEFVGIGIPKNMDNFRNMIEISKPAHLIYSIRYNYRTHGSIKKMTHGEMKAYTHKGLRADPTII